MSLRVTPRLSETPRAPGSQLRFNDPHPRITSTLSITPTPKQLNPAASGTPRDPDSEQLGETRFRGEREPPDACAALAEPLQRTSGLRAAVLGAALVSRGCQDTVPALGFKYPLVRHSSGGQKGDAGVRELRSRCRWGRAPFRSSPQLRMAARTLGLGTPGSHASSASASLLSVGAPCEDTPGHIQEHPE